MYINNCHLFFLLLQLFYIPDNIDCLDYKYNDDYVLSNGLAFPFNFDIYKGQNVMVKLMKTLINQDRCVLRTPLFEEIDLTNSKTDRIEKWESECSVKIKNIQMADLGSWQLISKRGNSTIQGIFTIVVKDEPLQDYEKEYIDFIDNGNLIDITFTKQKSDYCNLVQDKTRDNTFISGNCSLSFIRLEKHWQGKWKMSLGLPGRVEEVQIEKNVYIKNEDVDVGSIQDTKNNICKLYCNLINSERKLQFCRFDRVSDEKGFNFIDGLGSNQYSYFGRGFHENECGMTIEAPSALDYGTWRCTLGVMNVTKTYTIRRALSLNKSRASRSLPRTNIVLSVESKPLTINCQARSTISYCWFQHPNGTEFTESFKKTEDSVYWYSLASLDVGECEITIKNGSLEDSGVWSCHMGETHAGLETVDTVEVRVAGPLASIQPVIKAKMGDKVTLHCLTAGGTYALQYCRFILPNGVAFNINEDITKDKPILEQYYYPNDTALTRGDCAVTISQVTTEHFGNWHCFGMLVNEEIEYKDKILLENNGGLSTASTAGIAVGAVIVVSIIAFAGFATWKRQHSQGSTFTVFWRRNNQSRPTIETVVSEPRSSGDSEASLTQTAILHTAGQSTYGMSSRTVIP